MAVRAGCNRGRGPHRGVECLGKGEVCVKFPPANRWGGGRNQTNPFTHAGSSSILDAMGDTTTPQRRWFAFSQRTLLLVLGAAELNSLRVAKVPSKAIPANRYPILPGIAELNSMLA